MTEIQKAEDIKKENAIGDQSRNHLCCKHFHRTNL